jgi:thiol-disulfide isomerase/thioredoxin
MKTTKLIQASLLTATMLLNSGCFFEYFNTDVVPTTPQTTTTQETQKSSTNKDVECLDKASLKNKCTKELITIDQLKQSKNDPFTQNNTQQSNVTHHLKSIEGQPITIVEQKNGFLFPEFGNKIIILEIFGKECSHCIQELPALNQIRSQYRTELEIIAIQAQESMSSSEARNFMSQNRIHYPIIEGDNATNLQYFIQSTYGWTGILPYTLIIKNGITEFSYPGEISQEQLDEDIRSLLK